MLTANAVIKELEKLSTPERAKASAWYFKTGKGQYGYGDIFWGITVPNERKVAKRHKDLPFAEIKKLLRHKVHECRFTGLLILVTQYKAGDKAEQKRIAKFYLTHRQQVNNWDLVDSSAPYILGPHLLDKDRSMLYRLVRSKNLWDRRIAVISTFAFIRDGDYEDSLKLAKLLLEDKHDLIHKAVGWTLREVGKKSLEAEEGFLKKHASIMPRTMLRYAIEKFPEKKRKSYLAKKS
ncbi:MAG: DNA alkylation repair protein [Patescibacteria group bacterium]|nr:DNA alkylation repair protein [Patescibacteria group bacterium]